MINKVQNQQITPTSADAIIAKVDHATIALIATIASQDTKATSAPRHASSARSLSAGQLDTQSKNV